MVLRVLLFLTIFLVIFSGCSEEPVQDSSSETATVSTDEEVVEETVPEEAPVEEIEVAVIEPHATVESTNGAYSDAEFIDWASILTQQVHVSQLTNRSTCTIYMANFETTEPLRTVDLESGQAVIYFTLSQAASSVPVAGVYDLTVSDGEFTGSASIRLAGGVTVYLSSSNIVAAELEITSATTDAVTGNFNAQDRWTTMTGEFQVPII